MSFKFHVTQDTLQLKAALKEETYPSFFHGQVATSENFSTLASDEDDELNLLMHSVNFHALKE